MAEVNIPDGAVDAAVLGAKQARYEIGQHLNSSDGNHGVSADDVFRLEAQRALEAAAPLIVADYLERLVTELEAVKQEMREEDGRTIRSYGLGEGIRRIREHIAGLRGGAS